nr:MAG TPA: hypothetical protein [Caudoviricetes sp.]DAU88369.1 MAG TPA: hypothetical protein [Caudoviricetes sp.]DAV96507.1 MAG TPA: hypothetical protein [Caudoviricetes sp.]DAW74548.1 MAG TPA: hypothetical protein [Caudoviricetes sp.]
MCRSYHSPCQSRFRCSQLRNACSYSISRMIVEPSSVRGLAADRPLKKMLQSVD